MQRSPIACRRAARFRPSHPSPHIWISDDLLSSAINRFFRRGCLHQKRNGSHIPGPLEARRRAMKRRMTAQAHIPHCGPPPFLFNVGALFAARSNPQPTWIYEPPSFPPPERWKTLDPKLDPQLIDAEPRIKASRSDPTPSEVPAAAVLSKTTPQEQGVSTTADVTSEPTPGISEELVDVPSRITRSEHRANGQQRKAMSCGTEESRSKPEYVNWDTYAEDLKELIKTSGYEELKEFTYARYPDGPTAADFTLWVLDELIKEEWSAFSILRWLSRPRIPLPSLGEPKAAQFLERVEDMCTMRIPDAGLIARKMLKPWSRDPAAHPRLSEKTLCTLYRLLWGGLGKTGDNVPPSQMRLLENQMRDDEVRRMVTRMSKPLQPITVEDVNRTVVLYRKLPGSTRLMGKVFECLPRLLLREWVIFHLNEGAKIRDASVPHSYHDLDNWLLTLEALDSEKAEPTGNATVEDLVKESLSVYDIDENVAETILAGMLVRREFRHILDRARDANLLPLEFQDKTADALMPFANPLVHQLAYQYSLDRSRSYRQNWRSIYYLYKHLQNRGLPIGPLFSKAVTRVCLIQPLVDNAWVSSRRLVWVSRVVAQAEGDHVAKKLEDMFWEWRGKLIEHAHGKLIENGGSGRAHVSTMKTLQLI